MVDTTRDAGRDRWFESSLHHASGNICEADAVPPTVTVPRASRTMIASGGTHRLVHEDRGRSRRPPGRSLGPLSIESQGMEEKLCR